MRIHDHDHSIYTKKYSLSTCPVMWIYQSLPVLSCESIKAYLSCHVNLSKPTCPVMSCEFIKAYHSCPVMWIYQSLPVLSCESLKAYLSCQSIKAYMSCHVNLSKLTCPVMWMYCFQAKSANSLLDQAQQPYNYLIDSMRTRDAQIFKQRDYISTLEEDNRYVKVFFQL